jgi:uncharacterized protein (TIGR02147 family)
MAAPSIFQYGDYASYLRDAFQERKGRDRKFSHRYIGLKLGIQSSGWFSDILAGRKKLKARYVTPLASLLQMDARARDFFRVLVALEQADSPEELAEAREAWFALRGVSRKNVERDQLKYFECWYYPAVREILGMKPFQGDYAELAKSLRPPIQPRQAREAVATLTRLGLLDSSAANPGSALLMDTTAKSPAWGKIMQAYARLGLSAIEKIPKDERDISALTLTLPVEGLQRAGEEIAALRQRLLALSDSYKQGDRKVYQCLFEIFPLSRSVGGSRA